MRQFTFFILTLFSASASAEMPIVHLEVSGYTFYAEVAYKNETRRRGLMYRDFLPENSGMLFVFPKPGRYSMWMINTYIPLSIAFLDVNGRILNIIKMSPHTKIRHTSVGEAKYALEMNLGWFSTKNIKAGQMIMGLEKSPTVE